MKFLQVDPDAIESEGVNTSRGGVIGPIIQEFIKTGFYMAEIDCAEIGRKPASVSASVAAYTKDHILPVRPVLRSPRLFLQRRDVTKDGTPIENWKDDLLAQHIGAAPVPTGSLISFESVPLKK